MRGKRGSEGREEWGEVIVGGEEGFKKGERGGVWKGWKGGGRG